MNEEYFCPTPGLWDDHAACGISIPWPETEPLSMAVKSRVLTTRTPGNSPGTFLLTSVMINFLCHLDTKRDTQITGKMLFLDVSVRVFLREVSIWIDRRSKDFISNVDMEGINQSIWGLTLRKCEGRAASTWDAVSIFCPSSPALRYQHSLFQASGYSGFPDFPAWKWQSLGLLRLQDHVSQFL